MNNRHIIRAPLADTGNLMTDLGTATIGRAMRLAAAVHDYDASGVSVILSGAKRRDVVAICIALAAMIDVEKTPSAMLAWNDSDVIPEPTPLPTGPPALRPHGSHSAFARHKNRGETPCDKCVIGERTYQRLRGRRRRAEVAS